MIFGLDQMLKGLTTHDKNTDMYNNTIIKYSIGNSLISRT